MKAIYAALIIAGATIFSACRNTIVEGHGAEGSESRAVSKSFNSIEIDAPVDASISVLAGTTGTISLSGYNNLLKHIKTEVRDSTLHIFVPEITELHTNKNLKAQITVPSLAGISVSGSGSVQVTGNIMVPEFDLDFSGAGDVAIQSIQADRMNVDMSGATTLRIQSGRVSKAEYDLSGAVSIKAFGLETSKARIDLSGAGGADLFVTEKLRADVSGAGSVTYKGNPQVISDVSGIGSVSKADGTPNTNTSGSTTNRDSTNEEW